MKQAVAVREPRSRSVQSTALPALSPDQLKAAVEVEAARRRILRDFVRSQLESGKDYGTIDIRTRTGSVTQSKPVLFKSGMEKIFALFNVVSTLEKDTQTIEMVGKEGVIAYKCTLTRNGEFISEGRGAAEVSEKGRVNDAIKIAEKRARMDACLSLGFSEYFTQDLEDTVPGESPRTEVAAPVQEAAVAQPKTQAKVQAPAPSSTWRHGEVRDLEVRIHDKELKQSQTGTIYAVLTTDQGAIKAWKNTQERFRIGGTYKVAVEATNWNGGISLSVVRVYSEIAAPETEDEAVSSPA